MHPQYTPRDVARFWSKVDKSGSCWLWTAGIRHGYGRFQAGRTCHISSRVAYELTHGPIPAGMCVLHNCPDGDNPLCVNPAHLWLGTKTQNNADRDAKGRTARGVVIDPTRRARGARHGFALHPESRPRGARHGRAKVTEFDVREIRRLSAAGTQHKALAAHFGISDTMVAYIVHRKSWQHVD